MSKGVPPSVLILGIVVVAVVSFSTVALVRIQRDRPFVRLETKNEPTPLTEPAPKAVAEPKTEPVTKTAAKELPEKPTPAPLGPDELLKVIASTQQQLVQLVSTADSVPLGAATNGRKSATQHIVMTIDAAEKVLAHAAATPEQKAQARRAKLNVLCLGARLDEDKFAAQFEGFAKQLIREDRRSELAATAAVYSIEHRLVTKPARDDFLPVLVGYAKLYPDDERGLGLFRMYAQQLESANQPEAAIAVYAAALQQYPGHADAASVKVELQTLKNAMLQAKSKAAHAAQPQAVRAQTESPTAIQLSGPTLDGGTFDISAYRGKIVLVDFWATWCGPCDREMPELKRVYETLHEQGFEIVGVSLDDHKTDLADYVKKNRIPWPQIIFNEQNQRRFNNPLARQFNVSAIPATLLLDRDGQVVHRNIRGASAIEKAVRQLLQG